MSLYMITKKIEFCYGHRLLTHKGKCKHLHGHNAIVEVELSSEHLDQNGMVVDFGDLQTTVKTWIDHELDHKMILSHKDPLVPLLQKIKEPCYVMEDDPTAENIAKLICTQAKNMGLPVSSVRLFETPSSFATYRI